MKSLDFELDFWDADGWLFPTDFVRATGEFEEHWDEGNPDLLDSLTQFLHRGPPIDRILVSDRVPAS